MTIEFTELKNLGFSGEHSIEYSQDIALVTLFEITDSNNVYDYAQSLQQIYRGNGEDVILQPISKSPEILDSPRALVSEILRLETINVHENWKAWSTFNRLLLGDYDPVAMRSELFTHGLIDKDFDHKTIYEVFENLENWKKTSDNF